MAQVNFSLNQASHHAHMIGPADRVAAHQNVALELQAQMAPGGLVGQFGVFAAAHTLPVTKAGRDQAQRVEHIDLRDTLELGRLHPAVRKRHHVERRHARLLGSIGLNRTDDRLARDLVEGFGAVASGVNTGHAGLQVLVGQNAQQTGDARVLQKADRRSHASGADDQISRCLLYTSPSPRDS